MVGRRLKSERSFGHSQSRFYMVCKKTAFLNSGLNPKP